MTETAKFITRWGTIDLTPEQDAIVRKYIADNKGEAPSINECAHENPAHLADNSSSSSGRIHWCPDCGAISLVGKFTDEKFDWYIPDTQKARRLVDEDAD